MNKIINKSDIEMQTIVNPMFKFSLSNKTIAIVIDIVCYALIILFVYTATSKFSTYNVFERGLHNSVLLKPFSHILAWFIPGIEILLSVLLIIPKTRRYGLQGSLLLLIAFTTYLIYMISYGGPRSCGCGGVIESLSWIQHIWFNIIFIFFTIVGLFFLTKAKKNNLK